MQLQRVITINLDDKASLVRAAFFAALNSEEQIISNLLFQINGSDYVSVRNFFLGHKTKIKKECYTITNPEQLYELQSRMNKYFKGLNPDVKHRDLKIEVQYEDGFVTLKY